MKENEIITNNLNYGELFVINNPSHRRVWELSPIILNNDVKEFDVSHLVTLKGNYVFELHELSAISFENAVMFSEFTEAIKDMDHKAKVELYWIVADKKFREIPSLSEGV